LEKEKFAKSIRDMLSEIGENPKGAAVVIEAQHLCMQMRGVQKQHSSTTTSAFSGIFIEGHKTRAEFMNLIK
jgi:GTP cyclohydrolase I